MLARLLKPTLCAGALLLLGACASGGPDNEPDAVDGRIEVLPNLNPNARDRPSPVFLRVYQLKDRAAFDGADFGDFVNADTDLLGGALLSRDVFELCPLEMDEPRSAQGIRCQGETLPVTLDVYPDARYLAVVAEFYELRDATGDWRAVAELPEKGFFDFIGSKEFVITLDRSTVSVNFE